MVIAVTYEDGQVFQHFGHTEAFKLYTIDGGEIKDSKVVSADGFGHESLAVFLINNDVSALICGGIGPGAQNALAQMGIQLFAGVSGDADEAVKALLSGTLAYSDEANCDHHGEHHHGGHDCGHGDQGCGGHDCEHENCH